MGIRGLTSYITRNAHRFHERYQLHDCMLVIDGSSLACQLYVHLSDCNSAFGGDYDKYAKAIEDFFSFLKQCNVIPLVIVDGGYEARKLKTVRKRLKDKYHKAKFCNPTNQNTTAVFPLLMMQVFKQTVKRLGIKFAQADFEGDFEIAALARYLNCPVLSYDSDFYVFDVKYIPFTTLSLTLLKLNSDGSAKYYLDCEIYIVDHLISSFGGLDKSLLPLMGTLLGNDYVPASTFSKFYKHHVKLPKRKKMSQQQRRISAIFEWLRGETLPSAVTKILNQLKKEYRTYVKSQIELSVNSYIHYQSALLSHLGLEVSEVPAEFQPFQCHDDNSSEGELSEEFEGLEEDSAAESCSEESIASDSEDEIESHVPDTLKSLDFPPWLKDKFRRGELPSYVSDIYYLRLYFCQIQVEDFTMMDSHVLSLPILEVICGFLFSDGQGGIIDNCRVTCYVRSVGFRFQKLELLPKISLPNLHPFPPLIRLPSLPLSVRKSLLYCTFGITDHHEMELVESFGEKWQLFAMVVVYWGRSAVNPNITNCHLLAVIISMVALGVVDKKVGRIRHQKQVSKKKGGNLQKKQNETCNRASLLSDQRVSPNGSDAATNIFDSNPDKSLAGALLRVSETDCLKVSEFLLQFHQIDKKLLGSPRQFCNLIVHVFAQLQTCLLQAMVLNSMLEYPVHQCNIAETFSGSVAYMAFINFNRRSSVEAYISSFMKNSPTVAHVFNALRDRFAQLLPNLTVLIRKGKKKNKRKLNEAAAHDCSDSEIVLNEESDYNLDVNNKFSVLGIL